MDQMVRNDNHVIAYWSLELLFLQELPDLGLLCLQKC